MKANLDRLELELDGTVCARLTRTEADILRLFDSDRGRYFSRDEIIEALRGEGFACEDSMLYSHISNLRRKLSQASDMIENDRKVGYRLLK
jgi:DNA-binding response OmpR family regulator